MEHHHAHNYHEHTHTHEHMHEYGHVHTHEHSHGHTHHHDDSAHTHEHLHDHYHHKKGEKILCIRPQSGLSGDMLLCGLASLLELNQEQINDHLKQLNLPQLENCLTINNRFVNGIQGKNAEVTLEHEHCHRTLVDIIDIIIKSSMQDTAKELAVKTFTLLAEAEGSVHGKEAKDVTFHEVGALDSILDICLTCALFTELAPDSFISGPLPLADGIIRCAHGIIPSPAPAVLALLDGVAVCSFAGKGETVTPTAIALLKALGALFSNWASMRMEKNVLVYGGKIFENAPNGSIFALGRAL